MYSIVEILSKIFHRRLRLSSDIIKSVAMIHDFFVSTIQTICVFVKKIILVLTVSVMILSSITVTPVSLVENVYEVIYRIQTSFSASVRHVIKVVSVNSVCKLSVSLWILCSSSIRSLCKVFMEHYHFFFSRSACSPISVHSLHSCDLNHVNLV